MTVTLYDLLRTIEHLQSQRDELRREVRDLRRKRPALVRVLVERNGDCETWQEIETTEGRAPAIERGALFGHGTRGRS